MKISKLEALGKPYNIFSVEGGIEWDAIEQFYDVMSHDSIVKGALMPDAHFGYSLPIGAVVASKDYIFPSFVGYDIGCGMCAVPTDYDIDAVRNNSKSIFNEIYKTIPVGFNANSNKTSVNLHPNRLTAIGQKIFDDKKGYQALGSLGSGNHFIEIGHDEQDRVWVIIHSGSRGVGHGIATHYMKLASGGEKAKEGCYGLHVDSQEGKDYINDMNWGLEFALANRLEMMHRINTAIALYCSGKGADWDSLINRNHNHAELKDGLWIHRKGATHAEEGMMGVIPGNMRDGSFIVKGKGNPDSLYSSSHGAGRVLGRKQAKRELNTDDFIKTMDGITAKVDNSTLDEAPMAYKNIFDVMLYQADLIEVCHHIKPLINIKG